MTGRTPSRKLRILVAHSNSDVGDTFRIEYANLGHEVENANGGLDCIDRIDRRCPDVLVLDEKLLWGGAQGVLARLREQSDGLDLPVVLLYDHPDDLTVDLTLPPIVQWIRKPFHPGQLMRSIMGAAGEPALALVR